MYNILYSNQIDEYHIMDSVVNLHLIVEPLLQISKVELYRCLRDIIETSSKVQIYLYTSLSAPWIKELDKLMNSVFKYTNNINLIITHDYSDAKDVANYIDGKTNVLISREILLSSILTGICIRSLFTNIINKLTSGLTLKILFAEQAEKELSDDLVDQYRNKNNMLLTRFDDLLDTSIDFYSIFTESDIIENLIKSNNKDRSRDNILIVIDSVDRSSSVNCNNNSYYIPIDTYITPKILSNIFDIVLTNIHK